MPDANTKHQLAQQLQLSPQQVKIWYTKSFPSFKTDFDIYQSIRFQNKRARMRRLEKAMNPNEEEPSAGGITFHFFEGNDFVHEY